MQGTTLSGLFNFIGGNVRIKVNVIKAHLRAIKGHPELPAVFFKAGVQEVAKSLAERMIETGYAERMEDYEAAKNHVGYTADEAYKGEVDACKSVKDVEALLSGLLNEEVTFGSVSLKAAKNRALKRLSLIDMGDLI